ncbi:hypothetical protein [Methylobacterium oryzihabitans]|uniref:Uncharacterized protein n=1 Tax=Methylobacterium oryzihabitans TaxID=2499852 RepID=A0A3S2YXW9_9HYPH|nr:hypothetical protein [Methylobacterium oryzihabitans]RVU21810.1 hypothetical protein EOE48_01825 [Methylobacterium oryzihabitans]
MRNEERPSARSAVELLDSLEALGRTVAALNAAGQQVRVAVVPDGLWVEGLDSARGSYGRLIPTRDVARLPAYALTKEVEAIVSGR